MTVVVYSAKLPCVCGVAFFIWLAGLLTHGIFSVILDLGARESPPFNRFLIDKNCTNPYQLLARKNLIFIMITIEPSRLSRLSTSLFIFFLFLLLNNGTVLQAQGKLISLPDQNLQFTMPGSPVEKKQFKLEGRQFNSVLYDDAKRSGTQFIVLTLECNSSLSDSNARKSVKEYMIQQYSAKGKVDFILKKRAKTYLNGFPVFHFFLEKQIDPQTYRVFLQGNYVYFDEKILCWFVLRSADRESNDEVEEMENRFLESLSTLGKKPHSEQMPNLLKLSPYERQVEYRSRTSVDDTYVYLVLSGDMERVEWFDISKNSKGKFEQFTYESPGRANGEFNAYINDFIRRYRNSYSWQFFEIVNDSFILNGVETRIITFGSESDKNSKLYDNYINLVAVIKENILILHQFQTKKEEPHELTLGSAERLTRHLSNDSEN